MTAEMARALDTFDCGICLQRCEHPARLPCGHVFCYLCIKGIANRSGTCAFCRRPIPVEFLDNPQILNGESFRLQSSSPERFAWFYQAKTSGWWQYQQRDSDDLEAVYQRDHEAVFDRLIAGYMYVINFKEMVQHRKTDRSVYRRIKRDVVSIGDKVGIAGLRLPAAGLRCEDCSASDTQSQTDDDAAACAVGASAAGTRVSSGTALREPEKLQQPLHLREPCTQERGMGMSEVAPAGYSCPSEHSPTFPATPQESDNNGQLSSTATEQPASAHTQTSRTELVEAALRDGQNRSSSTRQARQRNRRSEDAGVSVLMAAMSMSDDRVHEYV